MVNMFDFLFFRTKMCRWWTMNALNGVGSVRVGGYTYEKSNSGTQVQKEVMAYRVADLPRLAKVTNRHSTA